MESDDEDFLAQLERRLNQVVADFWAERRRQIEERTAQPLPWHFDLWKVAWESECADGVRLLVEKNPVGKPCSHCKAVHPLEAA